MILALVVLAVFGLNFTGYGLNQFHFPDYQYLSKNPPALWGVSVVDAESGHIRYDFLYHNLGLMALTYHLIHRLPLEIEDKVVFVNGLNVGLQLLNAGLFLYVLRKLVGGTRLMPFLLLYLLYPFSAAIHYWQASVVNNLAASLFLASLSCFVSINYEPARIARNLVLYLIPSFVFLWLSIMTVEWAVCLSPLYVYLALYYSNGKTAWVWRSPRVLTPYVLLASLFLLTSILPALLGTGHRLFAASPVYGVRYGELAGQTHWGPALIESVTVVGNGLLVYASVLFANTVGIGLYPFLDIITHRGLLQALSPMVYLEIGFLGVIAGAGLWLESTRRASGRANNEAPDFRFLMILGLLWAILAYFPFTLSFGYPRNVGSFADRINLLGLMGSTLCLGSVCCLIQDRVLRRGWSGSVGLFAGAGLSVALLALGMQISKISYIEAEVKERMLIHALLDEQSRRLERNNGMQPIFLLDRPTKLVPPRAQIRHVLNEPSLKGKVAGLGAFVLDRHFLGPANPTNFNLNGIFWFYGGSIDFHADRRGLPRPLAYRREGSFQLTEDVGSYTLGFPPSPSFKTEFRTYAKQEYELVIMEIGEASFQLGGPLQYEFKPYTESRAGTQPQRLRQGG